jgi:hypothetical protein
MTKRVLSRVIVRSVAAQGKRDGVSPRVKGRIRQIF